VVNFGIRQIAANRLNAEILAAFSSTGSITTIKALSGIIDNSERISAVVGMLSNVFGLNIAGQSLFSGDDPRTTFQYALFGLQIFEFIFNVTTISWGDDILDIFTDIASIFLHMMILDIYKTYLP